MLGAAFLRAVDLALDRVADFVAELDRATVLRAAAFLTRATVFRAPAFLVLLFLKAFRVVAFAVDTLRELVLADRAFFERCFLAAVFRGAVFFCALLLDFLAPVFRGLRVVSVRLDEDLDLDFFLRDAIKLPPPRGSSIADSGTGRSKWPSRGDSHPGDHSLGNQSAVITSSDTDRHRRSERQPVRPSPHMAFGENIERNVDSTYTFRTTVGQRKQVSGRSDPTIPVFLPPRSLPNPEDRPSVDGCRRGHSATPLLSFNPAGRERIPLPSGPLPRRPPRTCPRNTSRPRRTCHLSKARKTEH